MLSGFPQRVLLTLFFALVAHFAFGGTDIREILAVCMDKKQTDYQDKCYRHDFFHSILLTQIILQFLSSFERQAEFQNYIYFDSDCKIDSLLFDQVV